MVRLSFEAIVLDTEGDLVQQRGDDLVIGNLLQELRDGFIVQGDLERCLVLLPHDILLPFKRIRWKLRLFLRPDTYLLWRLNHADRELNFAPIHRVCSNL